MHLQSMFPFQIQLHAIDQKLHGSTAVRNFYEWWVKEQAWVFMGNSFFRRTYFLSCSLASWMARRVSKWSLKYRCFTLIISAVQGRCCGTRTPCTKTGWSCIFLVPTTSYVYSYVQCIAFGLPLGEVAATYVHSLLLKFSCTHTAWKTKS